MWQDRSLKKKKRIQAKHNWKTFCKRRVKDTAHPEKYKDLLLIPSALLLFVKLTTLTQQLFQYYYNLAQHPVSLGDLLEQDHLSSLTAWTELDYLKDWLTVTMCVTVNPHSLSLIIFWRLKLRLARLEYSIH